MASNFRNSGSGSQYNNTHGTQNNNSGSGNQFVANTINYNAQNQGDSKLLADLRVTDPSDDKIRIEKTKGGLLRDSYRWILEHEAFIQWRSNGQSSLLWIKGDPGKGKTMLLCGIIDELPTCMPRWEAIYFFCEATDSRLNKATAVLRGLLFQLLRQRPSLSESLREEHEHAGQQLFEDVNSWYALDRTFTKILQDGGLDNTIIVIDALDECTTGLEHLLELVVRLASSKVKVIASSRNWLSIEEAMSAVSRKVCVSLELNRKAISTAVNQYISNRVDQLAVLKGYDITTRNEVCDYITTHANDTFLWVALVIEQLGKSGKRHTRTKLKEFPQKLDPLYHRMLACTLESEDGQPCRQILAVVSIVCRPVTLLELMSLAGLEIFCDNTETLEEIVEECGSLLTVKDGVVYFVHQSAKDFLLQRALAKIMPSGIRHEHNLLFSRSLDIMARTCRRNIYGVKEPGASLDDIRTPLPDPLGPARYACVYWLEHISDGGNMDEQQYSQVYDFLKQHFLHWIEALSLLKSMSSGVASLFKLTRAIQALEMPEPRLFIQDAIRFLRYFRVAVENWPLQLYSSALIFSPMHSIIRKRFEGEVAGWIIKKPAVDDEWSQYLQTLEGHRCSINCLAISPNGATLASASSDSVKLWDTTTGECLRTLQSHEILFFSVAFSLKGDKLVSASASGVIQLWEKATGRLLNTFHGTPRRPPDLRVTFCGGDQQIALGSQKTVEVWDTVTGQRVRQFMCQAFDTRSPPAVDFSADGALFASYTETCQVALFDTGTGQLLKTLGSRHSYDSSLSKSLAFVCDGTQLITGDWKSGLILWDTATSQSIWIDKTDCAYGFPAYSRDGGLIACSDGLEKTVEIRDRVTGKVLQTLHLSHATALTFSLDGTHLFSGTADATIGVWDLTKLQRHQLNEPNMLVSALPSTATSPNPLVNAIKEYIDAIIKEHINASRKQFDTIKAVAFSNDGKQLASVSADKLTIWDYTAGQCLKTTSINAHGSSILSLSYSSSGILFASKNYTNLNSITIWDGATGLRFKELHADRDFGNGVVSACFSKDGSTLAASSYDKVIKLWDVATGDCRVTFTFTAPLMVHRLRFSESGSQLIAPTGVINLESLTSTGTGMPTAQTLETMISNSQGLRLSQVWQSAWIQNDSKPILWIPPEYHLGSPLSDVSWVFDVRGPAIAIVSRSGRVLMMELSSDLSVM